MDQATPDRQKQRLLTTTVLSASAAYDAGAVAIVEARTFTREFLAKAQSLHGLPVSSRVVETAQLTVSKLVTNVCKYAPGPCLLDVEIFDDMLVITVWDSDPTFPTAQPTDPGGIGQHGLEIVLALCQGFDVRREPVGKRIKVLISLIDDPQNHAAPAGCPPQ